ncbi:MAG: NAD(P)/FAD-dependent oxidoreductase [Myxococcota bacterium]|jgi:cation diffusion facilitator CzcD-associated flavoprotein CzcO|nr:NAD(P)/FAD-dependent oxidoreductase [Myxococcota bacterium]
MTKPEQQETHDAIIIGAGVTGIFMLHKLLGMGMDVTVVEAAARLGGTWNKNRYPGCRFDSESYSYGYTFSKEIFEEWKWSEHFAGQPETLRYLEFVVDKLGLIDHMQFGCTVKTATYDEEGRCWHVELEGGRTLSARYLCTAIGLLSAPTLPRIDGMGDFEGESFHTYDWPEEEVVLAGKRVAVIGTGATGVQIISEIADKVDQLTVFQRRPNWCAPLHNSPVDDQTHEDFKSRFDEWVELIQASPSGFAHQPIIRRTKDVPKEERYAFWEELYASPGFGIWVGNYFDATLDPEANAEFSEFIARKTRERIDDPEVADILIPKDHGFGTRRVPLETRYYEQYNRDNVRLVDVSKSPIECITAKGIKTAEEEHEFDLIIYATGFDAITGAFDRMEIIGRDGEKLADKWMDGPQTYMGIQVPGFPNLLTLAGPQSASHGSNFPPAIEAVCGWACGLIEYMRDNGYETCEPTNAAHEEWEKSVREAYGNTLIPTAKSWFTGYNSNIEGHDKMRYLVYLRGAVNFRSELVDVSSNGYRGFDIR